MNAVASKIENGHPMTFQAEQKDSKSVVEDRLSLFVLSLRSKSSILTQAAPRVSRTRQQDAAANPKTAGEEFSDFAV